MTGINPNILRWARETAGLGLEEAADKLSIGSARGVAGADRLARLEDGEATPSRALLSRMAKTYRRPLVTFYLSRPPKQEERGEDFRTLPPSHTRADDALVDALLRDVRGRQEMVRSLLLDDEERKPLPYVASMSMADGHDAVLASIRKILGLEISRYRHSIKNSPRGFTYLRAQAEHAGIFVLLMGNLGSHHTAVDVELFRGFALADPVAPFVVINDQDAESAWSFTLLHELCHIWLGTTGVSGQRGASVLEVFCNEVASRFFFEPDDEKALGTVRGADFAGAAREIDAIAERLNVSRSMVAYRMLLKGHITRELWISLAEHYRKQWQQARASRRETTKAKATGPSYYTIRRHRVGRAMIDLTREAISEGDLSPSRAARMLGVRPASVYPLLGLAYTPARAS